jgi:DNA-binding response OmpR family regulator
VRALIADDDRVTAEILSRSLGRWGFDVTALSNGADAWAYLRDRGGPVLAVLDWMMPGMDGVEICRRVREELPQSNMYLMLLTARERREDLVAGLTAGADDYIIKPFDADELRARVHAGMRILTLQQTLAERVDELQDALLNVRQLRGLLPICSYCKRVRGDDEYWQQLESYIADHSDAQFSHGICPACYAEVTAELEKRNRES